MPVPFVYNGVTLANNLAAGNYDAASDNAWNIAGEAITTALTFGLYKAPPEVQTTTSSSFLDDVLPNSFNVPGSQNAGNHPPMGTVYVNPPPNATPIQIQQVQAYLEPVPVAESQCWRGSGHAGMEI